MHRNLTSERNRQTHLPSQCGPSFSFSHWVFPKCNWTEWLAHTLIKWSSQTEGEKVKEESFKAQFTFPRMTGDWMTAAALLAGQGTNAKGDWHSLSEPQDAFQFQRIPSFLYTTHIHSSHCGAHFQELLHSPAQSGQRRRKTITTTAQLIKSNCDHSPFAAAFKTNLRVHLHCWWATCPTNG